MGFFRRVKSVGFIELHRRWYRYAEPPTAYWGVYHFAPSPEKDDVHLALSLHPLTELLKKPCLFLLGYGGAGKTAEFNAHLTPNLLSDESLIAREARYLDGAGADAIFNGTDWCAALDAGKPIRIAFDSVDEALLGRGTFLDGLRHHLALAKAAAEARGLAMQIVLTSRLDWDEKLASEIAGIWGLPAGDCTYQLAPLSFQAALDLAATRKVADPRAFLTECARGDMERFACWPRTLIWLAEEFAQNNGVISSTLTRLQEARCARQFEDAARTGRLIEKLTPERTARWNEAAEWLACASIATGAQRFVHGRSAGERELDVAAFATALAKLPHGALPLNQEAFVDAMKFGDLFAHPGDVWIFQEQSDAEFLAARRLARLPAEQLAGFFGSETKHGWQVFPQLRTVAAMTAIASDGFRDWLLAHHPLVLIRADAADLPHSEKERIVAALLDLIESGRAPEAHDEESHLQTLRHRNLAAQLRPWLHDARRSIEAREMAIRIVAACADEELRNELSEDIWELASGPEADKLHWISLAVSATGAAWKKERLMRIARGELPSGRYWSLRGAVLFALFDRSRKTLPAAEQTRLSQVIPYLVGNETGVMSLYDRFLRSSHEHLRTDDVQEVCAVLVALHERRGLLHDLHPLHELGRVTLRATAQHIPDERAITVLADWWFSVLLRDGYEIPGRHGRCSLAEVGLDASEKRHALLAAMLRHPDAARLNEFRLHDLPVETDDWPWLLAQLPQLGGIAEKLAARLIAQRIHNRSLREENRAALVTAYAASEELRALLPPTPDGDIHAALLRIEEENERRWAAESAKIKRRVKERPQFDAEKELTIALEGCTKGDERWWPRLLDVAGAFEEGERSTRVWEAEQPQELPGWEKIPEAQLPQVRAAARSYLLRHPPRMAARNQFNLAMEATRHALCLLRDSLRDDVELRAAFRREWVEVILRHLYPARAPLPDLLVSLHALDSQITLDCIRETLEFDWDNDRSLLADHLDALWPREPRLCAVFLDVLGRSPLRPEPYRYGLAWLTRHDREAAAALALRRCDELAPQEKSDLRCVAIGTALLAFPEHWQRVWPHVCADPDEGVKCLAWVASAAEHLGWQKALLKAVPEHGKFMAALYGFFLKYLSPEPERRGGYTPTGMDHCRDLQRECHQALLDSGRPDLLQSAFAFAGKSGQPWTQRAVRKAETSAQAREWQAWTLGDFTEWLATEGATRITDADSLHRAVAESLRRFERAWKSGEIHPIQLWDLEANRPRREKFLSDALKQHLKRDLGPRLIPRRSGAFIVREPEFFTDEASDVFVEMALPDGSHANVIVEVKLCDHREVGTSMETQLAARYLREKNLAHGIYFVGWFGCDAWPKRKTPFQKLTLARARSTLAKQAASLSRDGLKITAVVVPCPLAAKLGARKTKRSAT
jgi:hypothetical protein